MLRQGQTTEAAAANQHTTALLQSVHSHNNRTEEETATAIDGAGDFSAAQVHAHMSVCKRNLAKNELKKLADPGGGAEMKASATLQLQIILGLEENYNNCD